MGKKKRNRDQRRQDPTPEPVADSTSPQPAKTGMPKWLIPVAVLAIGATAFIVYTNQGGDGITLDYEVLGEFKHQSEKAYTQGLEFHKGFLFEGTGFEKESDWRIVNLQTGKVCYRYGISSDLFGEGITILDGVLYQVTWRNKVAFMYDLSGLRLDDKDPKTVTAEDFKDLRATRKSKQFKYEGEGWGLTNDGTHLIMSSGSADGKIVYRDKNFDIVKTIVVTDDDDPVNNLNELEYHDGHIWANIYQTDFIVKIDAETGEVVGKADLAGILPAGTALKPDEVLNGIARDPASGKIYVTGKNWPTLFEVRFTSKQ
ncbi:MAG: glutaminyl-peptide cyclotransferase [Planctomycetes bacterium]|nr:glutaminyl-peptide cyclotransferase [Planctomycetota bacterium]